jgi:hypothetical protein
MCGGGLVIPSLKVCRPHGSSSNRLQLAGGALSAAAAVATIALFASFAAMLMSRQGGCAPQHNTNTHVVGGSNLPHPLRSSNFFPTGGRPLPA